jgi:biopolymer transport protein TolQ
MPTTAVETTHTTLGAAGDLSVMALVLQADPVVKAVLLVLLISSLWCWAIIFEKSIRFRRLRGRGAQFERLFWSGASLDDLFDRIGTHPEHPLAAIFSAAMREWRRSTTRGLTPEDDRGVQGLQARVTRAMQVTLHREIGQLERNMTFLATVGSTAPFIGLFGTVWGIMNSFQSIAAMKNTTLVVVAPGIAEALFATALGLVAAVPAVVAYNKLNSDLDRFASQFEDFTTEFGAILSRQLDEQRY